MLGVITHNYPLLILKTRVCQTSAKCCENNKADHRYQIRDKQSKIRKGHGRIKSKKSMELYLDEIKVKQESNLQMSYHFQEPMKKKTDLMHLE